MSRPMEIFCDGACSGNPGPAAIGFVIKESGKTRVSFSQDIGLATNNIAEYTAVVYALQEALMLKTDNILLHTDSELLYNQINGTYKIKNPTIKTLYDQIQHLKKGFKSIKIQHVPREQNQEADKLASSAIKKEQAKMVASIFDMGEESPSSTG